MSKTLETDAEIGYFDLETAVSADFARRLERERDEAITRRMETIMQCELYEQERDEAREDLEFRRGLYKVQEEYLEKARREHDEVREKYDNLATEHMLAINNLCKERDEWAAMCGRYKQERDELLNEIKKLRLDAQREAENHDRMVKELEGLYDKLKS